MKHTIALTVSSLLLATVFALPASAAETAAPAPQARVNTKDQQQHNGIPVFDGNQLDEVPRPIDRAAPVYPGGLRKQKITGEALVDFILSTEGKPENVRAIRATHPEFGEAAVKAVKKWRFKPGRKDGKPVNVRMQQPIHFNLNSPR